jgi:hypothetical protein
MNDQQFDQLKSFATALWGQIHDDNPSQIGYHQELMDQVGVPWSWQNVVASLMEKRENYPGYTNFLNLLSNNLSKIPSDQALQFMFWDGEKSGILT